MKKIRGDEPIGVIIHIHMEISQGNSLCCHFYLKPAIMPFFLLFICAYNVWVISPPFPHPLPNPPTPSLSLTYSHHPVETILPLSLISLKREYKQ
jgi:hypothetical protein